MVAVVFAFFIMGTAAQDFLRPLDMAATAPVTLTRSELQHLESRLKGRVVRVSRQGVRTLMTEARPSQQGLAYATSRGADEWPNPIPWSQVDTLWARGDRASSFALLGAVLGGVLGALGDTEDAGGYAGVAKLATTATGIAVGAGLGALGGASLHTWKRVYPIEPGDIRRGWSISKSAPLRRTSARLARDPHSLRRR